MLRLKSLLKKLLPKHTIATLQLKYHHAHHLTKILGFFHLQNPQPNTVYKVTVDESKLKIAESVTELIEGTASCEFTDYPAVITGIKASPRSRHSSIEIEKLHYTSHEQYRSGLSLERLGAHFWFPENGFLISKNGAVWRNAALGRYVDPNYLSTGVIDPPDQAGISYFHPNLIRNHPTVEHNALIGTHYASSNYGHFLLDIAPLIHFSIEYDIPIVCKPLTIWQRDIFRALKLNPSKLLVFPEDAVELHRPITSNRHTCAGTYAAHPVIRSTFSRILEHNSIVQKSVRKLFISRRNASNRVIRNRPALEDLLVLMGFEIIQPENYSFLKQAELFSSASILVCEFGAAFVNIVFCKAGTIVIEIIPEGMNDPWSINLATALELDYIPVFQSVATKDRETVVWGGRVLDNQKLSYLVDLTLLQNILKNS